MKTGDTQLGTAASCVFVFVFVHETVAIAEPNGEILEAETSWRKKAEEKPPRRRQKSSL